MLGADAKLWKRDRELGFVSYIHEEKKKYRKRLHDEEKYSDEY